MGSIHKNKNDSPFETIKLIIENGRPITLIAPIIIVSIYYLGLVDNLLTPEHIVTYLLLIFGVATLRLGINNVNNVYDVEVDKINKPHRPIPRGDLLEDSAFINGIVLQFFSLFVFMLISLEAFLLDVSFVVIAWLYNMDYGLKNIFIVNNLVIGYVRGFGYLLAVYAAGSKPNEIQVIFAIVVMFFIFGSVNSKDINDVEGDKADGRVTLPIVLEERNQYLALISAPFIFTPLITMIVLVYTGYLPIAYNIFWVLTPFNLIILYYINKATTTRLVENNVAWLFMMITYLGHHIVFYFVWTNTLI